MRTHRALLIALVAQIVVGALPVAAVEPAGAGAAQATARPIATIGMKGHGHRRRMQGILAVIRFGSPLTV